MSHKYILLFTIFVLLQTLYANVEALSCYQCKSSDNSKCINELSDSFKKPCGGNDDMCRTAVDENGVVTRDCASVACNSSECQSTKDENGNTHNICQTCNSADDPQCARSSNAVAKFNKVCTAGNTKCVISIKDKNTERRCATADDEKVCTETDTKTCKSCSGANCNVGIFPTNRLRCFQCDSSQTEDAKCNNIDAAADGLKADVCQFYDSEDKCYTIGEKATAMKRGCVSDSSEKGNKCSTKNPDAQCATCDKDECNNSGFLRDQSLKCVQCKTTAEDKKCILQQNAQEAKNCQNKIPYNKPEMCYTEEANNSTTVERGCLYDRVGDSAGICDSNAGCVTCNDSDGCNKFVAGFTCIICRSDIDTKCYDKAKELKGSNCRNIATKDEELGCFHGKWNGVVIRGCVADADERVQATCTSASNNQCRVCKEKDCNVGITSAASITSAFGALILLGIVFVLRQV